MTPALMRQKEAATYLGISVQQLNRLQITRIPMPGRGTGAKPRVWYRRTDLDAFIEQLAEPSSRKRVVKESARGAA